MSEKKYIKSFVASSWKLWVIALIVGAIVGVAASKRLHPSHDGSLSLVVNHTNAIPQQNAQFYVYDGYYTQQAAQTIRNNLFYWLKSPTVVRDIYKQANVAIATKTSADYSRLFKLSDNPLSSSVDVQFNTGSDDDTTHLASAIAEYVKNNYKIDNTDIVATAPVIQEVAPPTLLVEAGSILALGFLAFFVSLVYHYFKPE